MFLINQRPNQSSHPINTNWK